MIELLPAIDDAAEPVVVVAIVFPTPDGEGDDPDVLFDDVVVVDIAPVADDDAIRSLRDASRADTTRNE